MPIKDALQSLLPCPLGPDIHVTSWAQNVDEVKPGALFIILPLLKGGDSLPLVREAIAKKASVIVMPEGFKERLNIFESDGVVLISHARPRHLRALLAAKLYQPQPENVVAVTGTNGKSSVVHFCRQLFAALGMPAASMGTLGLHLSDDMSTEGMPEIKLTSPDPITLHRALQQLQGRGIKHVAIEASSHGLDQYRLEGVKIRAAAFTNLTRDHLDYHGTMALYFDAKARLFYELLDAEGTAVVNADDEYGQKLLERCYSRRLNVKTFGRKGRDYRILAMTPTAQGMEVSLDLAGTIHHVQLPLLGHFQVSNVLASLGLVASCGMSPSDIIHHFSNLAAVPGRMQLVGYTPKGAAVVVDYAHTPDALSTVLNSLRPHTANRLSVVFGCGGDRDPGKRIEMGMAAKLEADTVIVTDDNPRTEDPAHIRAQVLKGIPDAQEIPERRKAIETALYQGEAGDCIVIAGKGHEQGMIIGDQVLPFDDRAVVEEILQEL